MKRYHPILVVIHWVMLALIVMAWTPGQFVLEHTPNSDPGKIDALRMHMTVGLIAGALLILRLITKFRSEQPPHAKTGSALLDKAGVWAHWAFYVVILLIVASGVGTAVFTGLIEIVFQGSGAPHLPISMMSPHWAPLNLGPQSCSFWLLGMWLPHLIINIG